MTNAVTIHHDGTISSSHTAEQHTSSEWRSTAGIEVRSGIGTRTVADPSRIADSELVRVDGMEITAGMARDMGLGPFAPQFDADLSFGAARQRETELTPTPEQSTGHEGYDQTVSSLAEQVAAGRLEHQEATSYETALGNVALAGLTITEAEAMIDGLANGSVDPLEIDQNRKDVVTNLQATVTEAATQSAKAEIGETGYNRLAEIARSDAEFNTILRQYASMRALGKADHSWHELLEEAEAWVRGEK